jgi:hypothetical protein
VGFSLRRPVAERMKEIACSHKKTASLFGWPFFVEVAVSRT